MKPTDRKPSPIGLPSRGQYISDARLACSEIVSNAGTGQLEQVASVPGALAPRARRLGLCFVLGAVLGTLLDGIHAYGDVLVYPDPAFGRWAWFVPLEFGLLAACASLVMPALERAIGSDSTPRWSISERARELVLFTGLYLLTAVAGPGASPFLAVAFGALALVRLRTSPVPGDWVYVLAAAILGPAAEALMSAFGVFDYRDPDIAGVPYWLPALWANGGLLIRRLLGPIAIEGLIPESGRVRRDQ
jgi:hypothetical protein